VSDVIVTQFALLVAFQTHPEEAVTETLPGPPSDAKL
jgi:hypothetical protein